MIDMIGIRLQDAVFESIYVPFLCLANDEQKKAIEEYILQEVGDFFKRLYEIDKFLRQRYPQGVEPRQLSYSKNITEKDFQKIDIRYFYENFFQNFERKDNGKLELPIKWSITFDEKCTPIQLAWISPGYTGFSSHARYKYCDIKNRPHRQYGTIDINGTPVFYYIYFTLQEILDVVKQLPACENNI